MPARARSTEYLGDHVAVDVGQAKIAAGVAIDQPRVVDAHQVQDRRVIVVNVHRV